MAKSSNISENNNKIKVDLAQIQIVIGPRFKRLIV